MWEEKNAYRILMGNQMERGRLKDENAGWWIKLKRILQTGNGCTD
jgi:hypothetical protein